MGQMFTSEKIDALVRRIAKRQTKPIIDASIDDIADEIESKEGKRPSKSAVWLSLRRIGAVSSGHRFIYKHRNSHE